MIYQWSSSEKYGAYVGVGEADDRKIDYTDSLMGDPLPSIDAWQPPVLEQYFGGAKAKRKLKPIGDFPGSIGCLISQRAADALSDIWDGHALLYPVKLVDDADKNYYMVAVKTELDCLIVEQSSGSKTSLARDTRPFASLDTWAFDEDCVGENDLFVLPGFATTVFVSQRFKDRVVAAGLKGFKFKTKFWEDDAFVS